MHPRLLAFAVLFAPGLPAAPADPSPHLIEAESPANETKVKRAADPAASGGRFVLGEKPYELLFSTKLPPKGDSFTVWVRHRGHPVQLKALSADGKTQIEFDWAWYKGPEWRWSKLGTHSRATLGHSILLIRGPGKAAEAGIDAVILSPDPDFAP